MTWPRACIPFRNATPAAIHRPTSGFVMQSSVLLGAAAPLHGSGSRTRPAPRSRPRQGIVVAAFDLRTAGQGVAAALQDSVGAASARGASPHPSNDAWTAHGALDACSVGRLRAPPLVCALFVDRTSNIVHMLGSSCDAVVLIAVWGTWLMVRCAWLARHLPIR